MPVDISPPRRRPYRRRRRQPQGQQIPAVELSPKVELVSMDELRPYRRNAKVHSPKQIGQIAQSIRSFGWMNPIIADADGTIIAGHCRFEAANELGVLAVGHAGSIGIPSH